MRFIEKASALLLLSAGVVSCNFDRTDRWDTVRPSPQSVCTLGEYRCGANVEKCEPNSVGGAQWVVLEDCGSGGRFCSPTLLRCVNCQPQSAVCDGQNAMVCNNEGSSLEFSQTCDGSKGDGCREGHCQNLCDRSLELRSNVGCEYWGVDLDNAMISATSNAAAQQYAIVVSNPQPDLPAQVTIEQDDSLPGETSKILLVSTDLIGPGNLRVFKLGPREVDGSPEGQFDTGTGTALTRHAYRVRSTVPVVAYQFNPLDNVGVFSNDASLLKPTSALGSSPGVMATAYVAVGWPQTIAHTEDPDTNFNPSSPIELRAFLTIVGTRENTHVRVRPSTRVIPGGPVSETFPGKTIEATLHAFDVLNLESGGFNADFTGSIIEADQAVVVFSGGEASDAPYFSKLSDRFCCADHLEEQLDPIRTAGKSFIAAHAPNRTSALAKAGGLIGVVEEPEYYRIVAIAETQETLVHTTLLPPNDFFKLSGRGKYQDIAANRDFMITTDLPVMVTAVQASQDAAGVKRGLPGGDPSLIVIPPMEQYRGNYVFLTPDKYAFDFISISAPTNATVLLDGLTMEAAGCAPAPADGLSAKERGKTEAPAIVYRCQLSFPIVYPDKDPPNNVTVGEQNDGVHRVQSNMPVMVLVYGFDNYVSYGYAAGTELETINID